MATNTSSKVTFDVIIIEKIVDALLIVLRWWQFMLYLSVMNVRYRTRNYLLSRRNTDTLLSQSLYLLLLNSNGTLSELDRDGETDRHGVRYEIFCY